jgi:hypothetical protein
MKKNLDFFFDRKQQQLTMRGLTQDLPFHILSFIKGEGMGCEIRLSIEACDDLSLSPLIAVVGFSPIGAASFTTE